MSFSPHFTLPEFEKSRTAKERGLNNRVPDELMDNLHRLAEFCECVRFDAGGKSLIITSGFRGKSLNHAIGGAAGSYHSFALAVDLKCSHKDNVELARICAGIPTADKVIEESLDGRVWVHCQIAKPGKAPRQQWFTARKNSAGKTFYTRTENDFVTPYAGRT